MQVLRCGSLNVRHCSSLSTRKAPKSLLLTVQIRQIMQIPAGLNNGNLPVLQSLTISRCCEFSVVGSTVWVQLCESHRTSERARCLANDGEVRDELYYKLYYKLYTIKLG